MTSWTCPQCGRDFERQPRRAHAFPANYQRPPQGEYVTIFGRCAGVAVPEDARLHR
jgi:hypothetical protein